jgi:predicted RNA methylase
VTGIEQYYTPAVVAQNLVRFMVDDLGADPHGHWLDPAAGTGSFVEALHGVGVVNLTAIDIDPKHPAVAAGDFLATSLATQGALCLTNPPFGRNHSLSVPFFNHAAETCDVIAFIVPRSWRKWSVVRRLDPYFHKVVDRDITVAYETDSGERLSKSSALQTIFQVWERQPLPRPALPTPTRRHFELVKPVEADAALTVFGARCGELSRTFPAVPNTTKMFLKASRNVLSAIAAIDFSCFYTQVAYTEALSRVEIDVAVDHYLAGLRLPSHYLARSTLSPSLRLTVRDEDRLGPLPL